MRDRNWILQYDTNTSFALRNIRVSSSLRPNGLWNVTFESPSNASTRIYECFISIYYFVRGRILLRLKVLPCTMPRCNNNSKPVQLIPNEFLVDL
jgi:hypothetical protein